MFSKILYQAAKETFVEYLNKTSLNGCYLLYYIRRRKYQRLCWFMFIVMAVAFAFYVCKTILLTIRKDPTVTAMDPHKHSVYSVPFPSVAVCPSNKFSREAIQQYALNISLRTSHNKTVDYWEQRLEILSGLYNYDSIDFEEAAQLQQDLESLTGEPFKTRQLLETLAPNCDDLLVKCFFSGEAINCKEEFKLIVFMDGPCCVFNYQYMKNPESLRYPNSTGFDKGLVILLNSTTDDYFYAEDSEVGFNIKLFSTERIPDVQMGGIEQFHVDPGEDAYVHLHLLSQEVMEEVKDLNVQISGCFFIPKNMKGTFGKSECFLKCKIRFIQSKCDCIPFYALKTDFEPYVYEAYEECSLLSLECFEHYRNEISDFLRCSYCYPPCSYDHYDYLKLWNELRHTFKNRINEKYIGTLSDSPDDLSIVKIYYNTERGTMYRKSVLYKWYHILSNIGGVIGICMGCSIISGIEVIYFVCVRLLHNFLKLRNK